MFGIVVLQALYGLSIPLNKYILFYAAPFFAAGIRLFISGILLLIYSYRSNQCINARALPIALYIQAILFGVVAKYLLRNWALCYISASHMACLFTGTPFIAALLEYWISDRRLTLRQFVALLIGCVTLMPLVGITSCSDSMLTWYALPECMLFLAIVAHCYGSIITQKLMQEHAQSISFINATRTFSGGIVCLVIAWICEGMFPVKEIMPFVGLLFVLMLLSNGVCHYWSLVLLKTRSVTYIAFTDFLCTGFTLLYSALLLGEAITMQHIISICMVSISLYLFSLDECKSNYALQT